MNMEYYGLESLQTAICILNLADFYPSEGSFDLAMACTLKSLAIFSKLNLNETDPLYLQKDRALKLKDKI